MRSGDLLKFLLLPFVFVASVAVADGPLCGSALDGTSVAQHLYDLSQKNRLIHQLDNRLYQRQLIVQNGGLCGPTCAVNVIHAVADYLGLGTQKFDHADYYIHRMIDHIWQSYRKDARMGIDFEALSSAMDRIRRELGIDLSFYRALLPYNNIDPSWLRLGFNELAIASITVGNGMNHAIILLEIDTRNRQILYIDPNHPWSPKWVSYAEVYDRQWRNSITIGMSIPQYPNGQYGNVIQDIIVVRAN